MWLSCPTSCEEAEGPPKFLTLLSIHAMLLDPGSPSGISPCSVLRASPARSLRFLRPGFRHVKTVANCFVFVTRLNCFRDVRIPYGLHCSLCTLHNYCSPFVAFHGSFSCATLDTGCWLGFARQGLTPCKKRQAALGALTKKSAGTAQRAAIGWIDLVRCFSCQIWPHCGDAFFDNIWLA